MEDKSETSIENQTEPEAEPSSPSFLVLKTWDFEGLIIQYIYKPKVNNDQEDEEEDDDSQSNSDGKLEDEDDLGDDTSTVALDETETTEERLNDLVELESVVSDETFNVFQKLHQIPEEVVVEENSEDPYEGAAGLWAQDFKLPCFSGPPVAVVLPNFEHVALQQSSSFDLASSTDWIVPQHQSIQVSQSSFNQSPVVGSHFETLEKMSSETLINNREVDDCSVCKRPVDVGRGIVIKGCLHTFCRRCLVHAIENNDTSIMICPSKLVNCESEIGDEEIKALLTPEAYDKYVTEMLCKMNIFTDLEDLYANYEYVENRHNFQCGICLTLINRGDGLTLKNCLHQYCKPCLIRFIQNQDSADLPCPFRAEDGARCIGVITDSEMRSIAPIDVYLSYLGKSIAQAEAQNPNAFHCKTPNCKAWVEIIGELEDFECPGCKTINCIACKAVHQGVTCNDYQEMRQRPDRLAREIMLTENSVRNLIANKEAQPCPLCGILVQRIDGCRHLKCLKCSHDFKWLGV